MLMAWYTSVMSTTPDPGAAVVAKGNYSRNGKRRKQLIWVAILAVALVIAGFVVYSLGKQSEDDKLKQSSLRNSLNSAQNRSDDKATIKYSTELINGQKNGSFSLNDKDLGNVYLARAVSSLNTKDYKQAANDFPEAGKLNAENKKAALQGEIESRYRQGERKQLVPLYEELIEVTKKSNVPNASSSITQYEGTIEALQKGQDIDI